MFKSDVLRNPNYNNDELSTTWGQPTYNKYLSSDNTWQWSNFPNFSKKINQREMLPTKQYVRVRNWVCCWWSIQISY